MKHAVRVIESNLDRSWTGLTYEGILITGVLLSLFLVSSAAARVKKIAPRTFPFVISKPGQYLLKKDVVLPDSNTTAIKITADDVSLDLGNNAIVGPNQCDSSSPPVCPSPGSGIGIDAGTATGVTVQNGRIRGMGADGVSLGDEAKVLNVSADRNGGYGILVGNSADVENATTNYNGISGTKTLNESRIVKTNAVGNGGHGVETGNSVDIEGGIMKQNFQSGIKCGTAGYILSAHVVQNKAHGIECGNVVHIERVIAQGNTEDGIKSGTQSNVRDSLVANNDKGIELGSSSGFTANVLSGNTTSNVAGSGINAGENVCDTALCP